MDDPIFPIARVYDFEAARATKGPESNDIDKPILVLNVEGSVLPSADDVIEPVEEPTDPGVPDSEVIVTPEEELSPAQQLINANIDALKFYSNGGTLIEPVHGPTIRTLISEIIPPPVNSWQDLRTEAALDYYPRFYEFRSTKVKTETGYEVVTTEDPLEAAKVIHKKMGSAAVLLDRMLQNPDGKRVNASGIKYVGQILSQMKRYLQAGKFTMNI